MSSLRIAYSESRTSGGRLVIRSVFLATIFREIFMRLNDAEIHSGCSWITEDLDDQQESLGLSFAGGLGRYVEFNRVGVETGF
jgi:hypothetical protein